MTVGLSIEYLDRPAGSSWVVLSRVPRLSGDLAGRPRGAAREDHEARMSTKVDHLVTSALLRLDEGSW